MPLIGKPEVILRAKLILLILLELLPTGCTQSLPQDLRTWSTRDVELYLSRYGFKGRIEQFTRMGGNLIIAGWTPDEVWVVSDREIVPRRFVSPGRPHGDEFFITGDGKIIRFDSWPVTRALEQSATWYTADSGLCEYVSVYHGPQSAFEVFRIDQPDTPVFKMNSANGEDFEPWALFSTRTSLYLFDDRSKKVIVLSKNDKGTYPIVERFVVPGEFMDMSDDGQWILVWRRGDLPIDFRIGEYLFNVSNHKTKFLGRKIGKVQDFLADDFLSRRMEATKGKMK